MTLGIQYADFEVKSDRTPIDRAFFNRRWAQLFGELQRMDAAISSYGVAEQTLITLGLQRMNETLGPMLLILEQAAALGFLTCRAIGNPVSLVQGEPKGFVVTEGWELFTPVPVMLVIDETDVTNWGLVTLDEGGWTKLPDQNQGTLAVHVLQCSKTLASTQWSISDIGAMSPSMTQMLLDTGTARDEAQAAAAQVAEDMVTVEGLIQSVQEGPVASVAGKTGAVLLAEADIAGLVADLANKASISFVTSQVASKQSQSAKLDALINLVWAANKLIYATGAATLGSTDITDFVKTLLDDANASAALTTLGVNDFIKPLLSSPDAPTARTYLGVAGTPDLPAKASTAEVTAGTDDAKFVTSLGAANVYLPKTVGINTQSGTAYTLQPSDNGKIVRFTSASAVTVSLPATAAVGHNTLIEQFGAGQVTVNVVTNATRRSFGNKFKLAGQYATASAFCELNSDNAHAEWNVSGNLVA